MSSWSAHRDHSPTQSRIVDLNEVTAIDKDGEQVLVTMMRDGAKFLATGLYTKQLLKSLLEHNPESIHLDSQG